MLYEKYLLISNLFTKPKRRTTHGVLIPPACHHNRDVETKNEGQRYQIRVLIAVFDQSFEGLFLVCIENKSVGEIQDVIKK